MCAAKRYATKFTLLQELARVDENIKHPEMILGTSGTTQPTMMSPQRVPMYVKHVSQAMTLNNPDFPKIFTGTENLYGDMSSYYHKVKHRCQVVKVVRKFDTDHVGVVFIKDLETGEYDCIERIAAKSFTEVFGFAYNNERLDRLEENDIVEPGEILTRASSYDEYNNHGMGVNAMTLFSFHSNLTEDAAMISSSFAKRVTFNKVHRIQIKIPLQNMIPLNVHGDMDHYKVIPDIGEKVDHTLAALRHISITQMSDLSNDQLMRINRLQDTIYVGKGEIVDINIYTNSPFPEGPVYDQIRKYHDQQRQYYKQIYEFCTSIKKQPRTQRLKSLYALSMNHVNEDALWIDKNIIKSVIIDITAQERVHLTPGQKITG